MKKLLLLNGSPHREKSTTYQVAKAFAEGMCRNGDYAVQTVHVCDLHVRPCMGCLSCWARTAGECVIRSDDVPALTEQLKQADTVLECFPLYFFGMPGPVKTLTDRLLAFMATYRGQEPPKDGRSFHGLRWPDEHKRFVVLSSCAYSEAEGVYASLRAQFDCICGREGYTALFCPQFKTLWDMGDSPRLRRYLDRFRKAGESFAKEGALSAQTVADLSRPPFSQPVYEQLLDAFWSRETAKGQEE